MTFKERVWDFLDNDTRLTVFIMVFILISTLTYILDTYIDDPTAREAFMIIEIIAVSIFTIEYLVKVAFTPAPLKFMRLPLSIIDIVAIVPFWIEILIRQVFNETADINLSWIRVLRLFRVFRIFKVGKLTFGFRIFLAAIKMSMTSFTILIFFMCILIILSSSLMYMFEGTDPPHPMQMRPDLFASIPDCMWWSIVTMTTVGYGDAVPATAGGKVVATFTMCLGLLTIALPVTVLGSNFTKVMDMYEEELDSYSSADTDGSGTVSEDELRFFLYSRRQQGLIPESFSATCKDIMADYDEGQKGYLSHAEFDALFEHIRKLYEAARPPTTHDLKAQLDPVTGKLAEFDARLERMERLLERAVGAAPAQPAQPERGHEVDTESRQREHPAPSGHVSGEL